MPTVEDLNFQIGKLEFRKGDSLVLKFTEVQPSYYAVQVATLSIREALTLAGHEPDYIPIIVFGPDKDLGVLMFRDKEAVS